MEDLLTHKAIRAYLNRLITEEGILLIEKFPKEGEYSDEDLASTTGINLNTVRHTLYALYEKRLAEYRRIKNNETGWLTYLWQLRTDRIYDVLKEDMRMILEKLEARAQYEEENDFYICNDCKFIFTFNEAIDGDFTCIECREPLQHYNIQDRLNALKRRITTIKETLGHA